MLDKPDSCRQCPMWGNGTGLVPDEVPAGALVLLVAQNPGETEEVQGRPLVGVVGQIVRHQLVARHLPDTPVAYCNLLKCRWTNKAGQRVNTLPAAGSKEWQQAVACCRPMLEESLAKAPGALVVPVGAHSILALAGLRGKTLHLRGSLLREVAL